MVYKAIKALGPLKEYELELQMLEHLLSQQFWSRGKRGNLYERRAIVLGHLKARAASASDKTDVLYKLLEGLKEGLMDSDTGIGTSPFHAHVYIVFTPRITSSLASKFNETVDRSREEVEDSPRGSIAVRGRITRSKYRRNHSCPTP